MSELCPAGEPAPEGSVHLGISLCRGGADSKPVCSDRAIPDLTNSKCTRMSRNPHVPVSLLASHRKADTQNELHDRHRMADSVLNSSMPRGGQGKI